jgi:phosphoenolpyruvate-protein kinase (PTS system EI component)
MVNDLGDLRAVRAIVDARASELGTRPLALGVMVETPAAALLASQLAAEADFLSIGTNDLSQYTLAIDRAHADLSQYTLAIDRAHAELAERLDALHPAVLRMIQMVALAGHAAGKTVSVCGAMGSDVDALPILIGLGVLEVSATPAMVPRLKRTARLLDAGECRELARRALESASAAEVRELAQAARSRARASAQSIGG